MFVLIWGFRVFYRTIDQGVFHCRKCGGDRPYLHRAGRRFFTVFFIPIIPLNKVGEHVQCATCKTRYVLDVLSLPTAAQMQAALPAGMRAAATAMLRAGDPGSPAGPAPRRACSPYGRVLQDVCALRRLGGCFPGLISEAGQQPP